MNQKQVIIIINPFCHQGQGWKRWNSIKNDVLKSLPVSTVEIVLEKQMQLEMVLLPLLKKTSSAYIISAGGDGSMHYLVNFLLRSSSVDLNAITLGAVGLGSSNDFLKPFSNKINNIPVRVNLSGPVKNHDVGLATYYDEHNQYKEQYFIVNASFGVTAAANWNFNNPGKILKFLKSNFTGGAILYTAVTTILRHKNINCLINFDHIEMNMMVSNINILKIPFVSGSFWYNQNISVDDGVLGLNICRDMNKIELLKILTQLEKGKFNSTEKTMSEKIHSFQLSSANPVIFECDGETELANQVSITVVQGAIKILTD